jgi:hypothetical protein
MEKMKDDKKGLRMEKKSVCRSAPGQKRLFLGRRGSSLNDNAFALMK